MGKRIRHPKPRKKTSKEVVKGIITHTADHVQLTYHPPKEAKDGQKV